MYKLHFMGKRITPPSVQVLEFLRIYLGLRREAEINCLQQSVFPCASVSIIPTDSRSGVVRYKFEFSLVHLVCTS